MTKKKISILTPTYNEEGNVAQLVMAVRKVFEGLSQYDYEHVFIDNSSVDGTVSILKDIASRDKNVKIIINARNFGHVRSPYYGLLQCTGDAVVVLVADFQDPPDLIPDFLKKWEEGYKLVLGIKSQSKENPVMYAVRKAFYNLLSKASGGTKPLKNFTGFGLYDKKFLDVIRQLDDPYPYFRGMVTDLGFDSFEIHYTQQVRKDGITKNNLITLYDVAMLGFVNHSKLPLRLSAFIGFVTAIDRKSVV